MYSTFYTKKNNNNNNNNNNNKNQRQILNNEFTKQKKKSDKSFTEESHSWLLTSRDRRWRHRIAHPLLEVVVRVQGLHEGVVVFLASDPNVRDFGRAVAVPAANGGRVVVRLRVGQAIELTQGVCNRRVGRTVASSGSARPWAGLRPCCRTRTGR